MARTSTEAMFTGAGLAGATAAALSTSTVSDHLSQYFTTFVKNTEIFFHHPPELHEFVDFHEYKEGGTGININAALTVAALAVMSYMAYRMWSARGAGWTVQNTVAWKMCNKVASTCWYLTNQVVYYFRGFDTSASTAAADLVVDNHDSTVTRVGVIVPMGNAETPNDVPATEAPEATAAPEVIPLDAEGKALDLVRLWLEAFRSDCVDMQNINPRSFLERMLKFSDELKTLQASVKGGYDSPVWLYNLQDVKSGKRHAIVRMNVHDWGMNMVQAIIQQTTNVKPNQVILTALQGLVEAIDKLLNANNMVSNEEYEKVPLQLQYEFHEWNHLLILDEQRVRFWKWASIMTHFMVVLPQLVLNNKDTAVTTVPLAVVNEIPEEPALSVQKVGEELSKVVQVDVVNAVLERIKNSGVYIPLHVWHPGSTKGVSLTGTKRAEPRSFVLRSTTVPPKPAAVEHTPTRLVVLRTVK